MEKLKTMKVDRISYQKIFPTGMAYLNHKIGVEIQVEDNDDWGECFQLARRMVETWNADSNPSYAMTMEYMKPSEGTINANNGASVTGEYLPKKDERIQSFIATINMCTSLKFLNNFRARVSEENNPELTEAFNTRFQYLNTLQ